MTNSFDKLKDEIESKKSRQTDREFVEKNVEKVIQEIKDDAGLIKSVEVTNLPKVKDEIKINNLGDIKFPKQKDSIAVNNLNEIDIPDQVSVDLKKPSWFSFKRIVDALEDLKLTITKQEKFNADKFTKKQNPISVRLVDKDKASFYNAMGGGGGNYGTTGSGLTRIEATYDGVAYDEVRIDASTSAWNIVDYVHHEVHAGSHYHADFHATALAADADLICAFKTPDTAKWTHLIISAEGRAEFRVEIFETVTWTTNTGTAYAPINNNRNSVKTSTLLGDSTGAFVANELVQDPTGLNIGAATLIYADHHGAGRTEGGGGESRHEFVLKQNTQYAIVLTMEAVGGNDADLELDWYEHTDRN